MKMSQLVVDGEYKSDENTFICESWTSNYSWRGVQGGNKLDPDSLLIMIRKSTLENCTRSIYEFQSGTLLAVH
jgi:hypothetical protein